MRLVPDDEKDGIKKEKFGEIRNGYVSVLFPRSCMLTFETQLRLDDSESSKRVFEKMSRFFGSRVGLRRTHGLLAYYTTRIQVHSRRLMTMSLEIGQGQPMEEGQTQSLPLTTPPR